MNITELPSGSFRIRESKNGRSYSATVDHKPGQREARALLDELQKNDPILADRASMTFSQAYDGFISAKTSVLSPSTVKGYRTAFRGLPEWFAKMPLHKIDRTHVQKVVNDYSADHSPKTVKNQYGLVSAVMNFYGCRECPVTLPQAVKPSVYIPGKEDIASLLKVASGSKYEVAIRLGIYGLRRSEILALTIDDLEPDNVLTINKALVEGVGGSLIKTTKTTASTRTIVIDQQLADLIRQQGYVYDGSATRLSMAVATFEDAAGLPHFPLHKLRHFFASYMHELGFTDKQIQEAGGWSSNYVMKSVYTHAMEMDEAKENMSRSLSQLVASATLDNGGSNPRHSVTNAVADS